LIAIERQALEFNSGLARGAWRRPHGVPWRPLAPVEKDCIILYTLRLLLYPSSHRLLYEISHLSICLSPYCV